MSFRLEEREPGWCADAPIRIQHELRLPAAPARVFEVLADSPGWTRWFKGMRRVRVDGAASGVGALRTVWVGPTTVQEHFTEWEEDRRIAFHVVRSNSPGLRAMVEDYDLSPDGEGTRLVITVGIEAKGPFRSVPGVVRFVVGHLSGGVLGITSMFPAAS